MLRQRIRNVFIISAELNLLLGTSNLSQKVWMRVEQNFSLFFSGRSQGKRRLIFASATLGGCNAKDQKPDANRANRLSARGHAIAQRWPIIDLRFQLVASPDRAHAGWGPRQNDVAREQSEGLTGERNNLRRRVNHLTSARPLAHLAILAQLEREIPNVNIGVHERPDRRVSVERFATRELFFGLLQIPITDIEPNRVSENEVVRLFDRNVLRPASNDNAQLGLKIGLMIGKRDLNLAVVRQQRTGRLEPDQRCPKRRPLHLRNVVRVIQSHCNQL